MRVRRLDLIRYGRFTDQSLDFPVQESDLHIVFGRNEAGKSTTLAALEDLLFSIPGRSPFDFLHDYSSMRLGARLEQDGESLELCRRKGNRDTVLDASGVPLAGGEGALAPFLAGADRAFFERMFSLDHERLRSGGQAILDAGDEAGQVLFTSVAGIEGLRATQQKLADEADGLWGKRRAAGRTYYQAKDRLEEADQALREHTITTAKWQELKQTFEDARAENDDLEQRIQARDAEQRKLGRIRRVHQDVRRYVQLQADIGTLADAVSLPEDALDTLQQAEKEDAGARASLETLTRRLEDMRQELDRIGIDTALLEREDDIVRIGERRAQALASKRDLPKRRAELAAAHRELLRHAAELGWQGDAESLESLESLIVRIPTRPQVVRVRDLLTLHGKRQVTASSARKAWKDAEAHLASIEQQLETLGESLDTSQLAAAIRAVRARGDLAARIASAEREAQAARIAIKQRLASLKPAVDDENALLPAAPPRDAVQTHRDRRRDLDRLRDECRHSLRDARQECFRLQAEYERDRKDERAVPPERLAAARQQRDQVWALIRRRHIEGELVDEDALRKFADGAELAPAYERFVSDADRLADQRFDNAEAAARLAETARKVAAQKDLLQTLGEEEQALAEEDRTLANAWRELWVEAPVEPASADDMLQWLAIRAELIDCIERRKQAEARIEALHREECEDKGLLLGALGDLGKDADAWREQPLRVLLEQVDDLLKHHEQQAAQCHNLERSLREAKNEVERKQGDSAQALEALSQWHSEWAAALSAANLEIATPADGVAAQLKLIDDIRDAATRCRDLQHQRIDMMEHDLESFEAETADLVRAVAADLERDTAEDAALALTRRLNEARQAHTLRQKKEEEIAALAQDIRNHETSRQDALGAIRFLEEQSGAETNAELRLAIERSDKLRTLRVELTEVTNKLREGSDGHSVDELRNECASVDLDGLYTQEQAKCLELDNLRQRHRESYLRLEDARATFEAVGGDDGAAVAAADRQAALAEMREIAQRYARVRTATLLLDWGIERHRKARQAPLLDRAGTLFSTLTGGSFTSLTLDFDSKDNAIIVGKRPDPDGAQVPVSGLSTGSADQLYLALRVAAIEDYLNRAQALPFVADDLFVHFDDDRAAAGFQVLGELARRCQVIFFTHHEHLLDIAEQSLSKPLSITKLL